MKTKEEITNEKKFMDMLAKMRPDLWSIEVYRQELGFGALDWLKYVMKAIFNVAMGSGAGEVISEIRGKKLIRIRGSETTHLDKELFGRR